MKIKPELFVQVEAIKQATETPEQRKERLAIDKELRHKARNLRKKASKNA